MEKSLIACTILRLDFLQFNMKRYCHALQMRIGRILLLLRTCDSPLAQKTRAFYFIYKFYNIYQLNRFHLLYKI